MKVLFIGNSYTFFNNLPGAVAAMAASVGREVSFDTALVGGKDLQWHWEEGEGPQKITHDRFDVVVLQDHSLGALQAREKMFEHARKFDAAIKERGAQTVFFMTWARRHAPEAQAQIAEAYLTIAHELGARVAPVGTVWRSALQQRPGLVLHVEDGSHPNQKGSYLAACAFFATLLDASPVGLPAIVHADGQTVMELEQSEADFLQRIAWDCVKGASQR